MIVNNTIAFYSSCNILDLVSLNYDKNNIYLLPYILYYYKFQ